jgi:hypothetical protein
MEKVMAEHGEEIISQEKEEIISQKKRENLARAFELLASLPADGFSGERHDPIPQKRARLY